MDFLYSKPLPDMTHLSQTERAYIAGIVDGEGHMSISLYMGRPTVILHVCNTHRPMIIWLHGKLGGAAFLGRKADDRYKALWRWEVRTARARSILATIESFLIVKQRHAELIRLFYDGLQSYRTTRPHLIFNESIEEPLKGILKELRTLNRRGPHPLP